jgi:hypothetical protein
MYNHQALVFFKIMLAYFIYWHRNSSICLSVMLQLTPQYKDIVMVGAALSREYIAHECAPTEILNMSGYKVSSPFSFGILELSG